MRVSGASVVVGAATVLALGAGLSGCGSDDADPPARASATSSEAPTVTSSAPTTPATSTSPSATPSEPAVSPATGREVSIGPISMRIPAGWSYHDGGINPFIRGGTGGLGSQYATISSTPDLSGGNGDLDRMVKDLIKSAYPDRAPKRLPDREIDGVLFARLKGPTDDTFEVEHYITLYQGNTLEVEFDLVRADGAAANTAIVEESLATVSID